MDQHKSSSTIPNCRTALDEDNLSASNRNSRSSRSPSRVRQHSSEDNRHQHYRSPEGVVRDHRRDQSPEGVRGRGRGSYAGNGGTPRGRGKIPRGRGKSPRGGGRGISPYGRGVNSRGRGRSGGVVGYKRPRSRSSSPSPPPDPPDVYKYYDKGYKVTERCNVQKEFSEAHNGMVNVAFSAVGDVVIVRKCHTHGHVCFNSGQLVNIETVTGYKGHMKQSVLNLKDPLKFECLFCRRGDAGRRVLFETDQEFMDHLQHTHLEPRFIGMIGGGLWCPFSKMCNFQGRNVADVVRHFLNIDDPFHGATNFVKILMFQFMTTNTSDAVARSDDDEQPSSSSPKKLKYEKLDDQQTTTYKELYEASKKNGESLRVQVEDVRMDLLKAQKALMEKKEAMDQLLAEDAEVHQKSLQHDNLKAEYAALKAVMSTKETESNQLKQIISRLNSSYDKLKLDTSDLQKANDELMKTNVDLESKLGSERLDLDQSMNEIRGQVETSSTALKTCQEDVRQKNEIIDSLIKEVEDETAKGQSLEANFEAERSKVANLEGRLEAEKANVKNELLELTKRNKTMEDKCLKMEDNIIKAAEDKSMIRVKIEEAGKIKSEAEQNMSDLNDHQTDFKVSGSAANAASVTTTRTSTSSEKASEAAIVTKLKARLEKYKIQIKSGTKIVHEHAQMKVREEAVNAKIKDFKATKASFEKLTKEHKKLKSILRIREDEIKVLKDEDDRSDEEFVDKFIVK